MTSRSRAVLGAAAGLGVTLTLLVACSGPASQLNGAVSPSPTPPTTVAATPIVSASPSPAVVAFPDAPIIVGTSEGELRRARGATWELVAKPCPAGGPGTNAISSLQVAADGITALVQCAAAAGSGGDPGAGPVVLVDLGTGRVRPGPAVSRSARIGPMSPDGKQAVIGEMGDCPSPAPVCQSKHALVDLETATTRQLLPSDYYLGLEMRWTSFGLTYFQPECASAGCSGTGDRGGSFRWSGTGWTKFSTDRLIDTTATQALYERRKSLTAGPAGTKVVERVGGTDRVLTPPHVDAELAPALIDGRIYAWRPGRTIYEGTLVVSEGGRAVRESPGRFSAEQVHRWGDWLVATELSGAPSWTLLAYSLTRDAFASRFANIWISGLAVAAR